MLCTCAAFIKRTNACAVAGFVVTAHCVLIFFAKCLCPLEQVIVWDDEFAVVKKA